MSEATTIPAGSVFVKLVGVLSSAAGTREIAMQVSNIPTVQEVISQLLETVNKKLFRELLIDSGTGDPRPNVIILLNDQDCNVFDGLKTLIELGTKVTIIPVAHGG